MVYEFFPLLSLPAYILSSLISSREYSFTALSPSVTLPTFSSWNTTISLSLVSCTSSSIPVIPGTSAAALKLNNVFSGYLMLHPLCAHTFGMSVFFNLSAKLFCPCSHCGVFQSRNFSITDAMAMLSFSVTHIPLKESSIILARNTAISYCNPEPSYGYS